MAKFVRKESRTQHVEYRYTFRWANDRGSGFGFECDARGNIFALTKEQADNLKMCRDRVADGGMIDEGVAKYQWIVNDPAIIECVRCSKNVTLHGFTNTCICGADYNLSGQLLADRKDWGDETGETAGEILMGGYDDES
jgi:hypothetical protein